MRSRAWLAPALSAAVYVVITVVMGRAVIANLGSSIANDPGDPLLTAAVLKWNATHIPFTDAWYQFPIFHPTRDALTFSEHLLGLSLIASPIYWLTGDTAATYNIVLLLTFPLSAMAMYALVFRLTGSVVGAFVAGLAYAFAPYRVSQLPHIQMLASFGAPLALLGLHAFLETGKRRWLALYGGGWLVQGAANGYALVFFSVLVGLWGLWFVVARGRWKALVSIGAATAVAAIPLAVVMYRYITVHSHFGFRRGIAELTQFSSDIAGVLCAPSALTFWGWLQVQCGPEGELFPGLTLIVLAAAGLTLMLARPLTAQSERRSRVIRAVAGLLLAVALIYAVVILVVWLSGPFRFEIGPMRISASSAGKPVLIFLASLVAALILSPGVREALRQASVVGFYLLAALATWLLSLGPVIKVMGTQRREGPYALLMSLPGVDGLRVPARFWLMTLLCLCVVGGLVLAELTRRRSRPVAWAVMLLAATGVLIDGWVGRIPAAALPAAAPGAELLRGATVLELPVEPTYQDIASVYRAVDGGWTTVNGYSGWVPTYYPALARASYAESPEVITPFLGQRPLHVLVKQDAPGLRSLVESMPGFTRIAANESFVHYLIPQGPVIDAVRPEGTRLPVHQVMSECSPEYLGLIRDLDETTAWQCPRVTEPRPQLTVDLGTVTTVGAIVLSIGAEYWQVPGDVRIETSLDGITWMSGREGPVRQEVILGAFRTPTPVHIVLGLPARAARFVRLSAGPGDPPTPLTIAELEVWSSSSTNSALAFQPDRSP